MSLFSCCISVGALFLLRYLQVYGTNRHAPTFCYVSLNIWPCTVSWENPETKKFCSHIFADCLYLQVSFPDGASVSCADYPLVLISGPTRLFSCVPKAFSSCRDRYSFTTSESRIFSCGSSFPISLLPNSCTSCCSVSCSHPSITPLVNIHPCMCGCRP